MNVLQKILTKIKNTLNHKRAGLIIFVIWGIIFGSITFVNHYTFRTSSDPIAIYTNCLYDYRQLSTNECTLLTPINAQLDAPFFDNKLSDHFNILLYLIAPFSYVFGSWTLLIFQYIAILVGGIGIRKYFLQKNDTWFANLAVIHFFSIWGIYSALGFDYHDNVIAAMLVPWLFYHFQNNRWVHSLLFTIIILMCKENMALWMTFIFISLALFNWKNDRSKALYAIAGILISSSYFILVTKFIMPSLANEGRDYLHFHYTHLGNSYGEAIKFMLTHPIDTISMLFTNHTHSKYGDGVKFELIYTLLFSGGFLLFLKPKYLLMILPIIGQKLLSDDMLKWGLNYHYCIEFVPILTFCVFEWAGERKNTKHIYPICLSIALCTFGVTLVKNNVRTSKWFDKSRHNFLTMKHYTRSFNISETWNALKLIPTDEQVKVSAHFNFAPHLSLRDKIYEFPVVHDADFIVLFTGERYTYPLNKEEFSLEIKKYRNSECWVPIYDKNQMLILKRDKSIMKDYTEYPWHLPKKESH